MVYYDISDRPADARIYRQDFLLLTPQWDSYIDSPIPLNWKCVKFEQNNANQIPTKKGVYAFFIEPRIAEFPSHGYLMYIGQAGYNSRRDLQKRFRDYLHYKNLSDRELSKYPSKESVHFMLNTWGNYLYFYYVTVDPSQINIKQLEQKLLDTFTPPFTDRGYSAKTGRVVKVARR